MVSSWDLTREAFAEAIKAIQLCEESAQNGARVDLLTPARASDRRFKLIGLLNQLVSELPQVYHPPTHGTRRKHLKVGSDPFWEPLLRISAEIQTGRL